MPAAPAENGKSTDNDLKRELGLFPLTNIVIANMIGAGALTLSGILLAKVHSPLLMMILWLIGGLTALCGALCYGQLGAAMPQAGGEYVFLSRLFHPLAGFLSGWISFFVGFSAPIAASALACVEYLERAYPSLLTLGMRQPPASPVIMKKIFAAGLIMLFTFVHRHRIRFGARVQNGITIAKIAGIALFVVLGFAFGKGDFAHLFHEANADVASLPWQAIGLSFLWIMFAYSGWNASAYIGSEIRQPKKNLPLSLLLGTGAVTILYLALNLLFVYAVPPTEVSDTISIGGLAAAKLFGRSLEQIVSVFIALALFSSLSAYIMLGPRVYFSMAKDGLFFRFAAKVHPRHGVPSQSILCQGAVAILMVTFGTYDQLLTYLGFALGIFPILAVLGLFQLKKIGLPAPRIACYPLPPLFFIAISVLMLVLSFLERPVESMVAILTLAAGIPIYFLIFKGKLK